MPSGERSINPEHPNFPLVYEYRKYAENRLLITYDDDILHQ
jgi:hypothetical protein